MSYESSVQYRIWFVSHLRAVFCSDSLLLRHNNAFGWSVTEISKPWFDPVNGIHQMERNPITLIRCCQSQRCWPIIMLIMMTMLMKLSGFRKKGSQVSFSHLQCLNGTQTQDDLQSDFLLQRKSKSTPNRLDSGKWFITLHLPQSFTRRY